MCHVRGTCRRRQPPAVAALVSRFARRRILAVPFIVLQRSLANWFVALKRPWIATACACATAVVASSALWLASQADPRLVGPPVARFSHAFEILARGSFALGFGFDGAATALSLTDTFAGMILLCAGRVRLGAEHWPKWSLRRAAQGWLEILRLALPVLTKTLASAPDTDRLEMILLTLAPLRYGKPWCVVLRGAQSSALRLSRTASL